VALSIGVRVGTKIDIAGHIVQVKGIVDTSLIVVTVDGGPDMRVSDKERITILPDVYVFVGGRGQGHQDHRLAFEAPKLIRISRIADIG
jgi:hypothetical protein